MRTNKQQPFNITPSKTKRKYVVPAAAPSITLEEFKEKLAAAATRRNKVY